MTWHELISITQQCVTDEDRRRMNALIAGRFCEMPGCERFGDLRRQNTQYVSTLCNWGRYCEEHQGEADAHWEEMWSSYYADVGVL